MRKGNLRTVNPSYRFFAEVYDVVMRNVDYPTWAEYVINCCERFDLPTRPLLNLAAGTASLELELWKRGVRDILATDASPDMLRVGKEKCRKAGAAIHFRYSRMEKLDLPERFGLVTCLYDSVNYLHSKEDLRKTLEGVHHHLRPGGGFIFDIATEYNIIRNFADYTFAETFDEFSYIWENSYNIGTKTILSKVTMFILEDGMYRKHVEDHVQKMFSRKEVRKVVEDAGLELIGMFDGYTFDPPGPKTDRIHFVTRRGSDTT